MIPLRRQMPDIFDHGSKLKLVSAAGIAPAIPRSQAECVAATLRADAPSGIKIAGVEIHDAETLGISLAVRFEIGGPEGTCTLSLPADNGLLLSLSYESEMVGSAGNGASARAITAIPFGGPAQAVYRPAARSLSHIYW